LTFGDGAVRRMLDVLSKKIWRSEKSLTQAPDQLRW
jgi:hypothetical protein